MRETFYLIDGHAQFFRAYYAPFGNLTAPDGEPVKATHIFTQMVLAILRDRKPEYLAVAVDSRGGPTRRLSIFPEYKANRMEAPEDLAPQIARILEILDLLEIPVFDVPGYEADDIIATLARRHVPSDVDLCIVSRDKDLYQILGPNVKLWDPQKDEFLDEDWLRRTHGFSPAQSVEIQTLTGDGTDNIPGIPGIGPKTALGLILAHGTADGVLAHAEDLPERMARKILEHRDQIPLARSLVTLEDTVPLDFSLERCRAKGPSLERLRPLLERLNLKRILEQLLALEPSPPPASSRGGTEGPAEAGTPASAGPLVASTPAGHHELIDTPEAFEAFLARLAAVPAFSVDTETTSLRPVDCELVGLSFAWEEGRGHYIPVRSRAGRTLPPEWVLSRLKPFLEDPSVKKCGQNLKYDLQVLRSAGVDLRGVEFDSMVASYLLRPEERGHDIDTLAREYCGHAKIPTEDLIGRGKSQTSMLDVDTRRLADYAGEDADIAWRLRLKLAPRIETSGMNRLFAEVEMPLVRVLADMEYEGIRVDCGILESVGASLDERIGILRTRIHREAGHEFLIDSPKQLAQVLFDELGLRVVRKTKTSRSTDAEVLETLTVESAHPLPGLVLQYRELSKLRGTYVEPIARLLSPKTGRLHASFHQAVAATGRLSSSDPNMQNIPVRSAEGREIRKAFVPRDREHVFVVADYNQVELRILAHLSGDEALLQAFREDRDIHAFVAAQLAGVAPEEVSREARARAKAVNFGIIYGQGAFGLARSLGIGQREAAEFIAGYKRRYPGIAKFMETCVEEARRTGRVTTLLGRERPIPEVLSQNQGQRALGERIAVNTVVQGTAADLIKVAMVRVHARLAKESPRARILVQVHDELVVEVPRSEAEGVAEVLRSEMAGAIPLSIPLRVDLGRGDDWLAAKS